MTWAYQQDSTHASFPNYNKDQMTMYNMTVNAAQQAVLTHEDICGLIPAGTSIQNLRSSYLGDTLTRDGYHMSKDYGRYTVALTWYGYFTGGALELVNWYPDEYAYVESDIAAIRDAVDAALETPLAVTPSRYPNSPNAQ